MRGRGHTLFGVDFHRAMTAPVNRDGQDYPPLVRFTFDRFRFGAPQRTGFVAKYMGDGVLVYFGYPPAHEDDADPGVRAGLQLSISTLLSELPSAIRHVMTKEAYTNTTSRRALLYACHSIERHQIRLPLRVWGEAVPRSRSFFIATNLRQIASQANGCCTAQSARGSQLMAIRHAVSYCEHG
jgi:class 3 adenylate cyclase